MQLVSRANTTVLQCKEHTTPDCCYEFLFPASGTFHGGDNDSTGTIASCWFGALYGLDGVYERNHKVGMPL